MSTLVSALKGRQMFYIALNLKHNGLYSEVLKIVSHVLVCVKPTGQYTKSEMYRTFYDLMKELQCCPKDILWPIKPCFIDTYPEILQIAHSAYTSLCEEKKV